MNYKTNRYPNTQFLFNMVISTAAFVLITVVLFLIGRVVFFAVSGRLIFSGEISQKVYTPASSHARTRYVEYGDKTVPTVYTEYTPERYTLVLTGTTPTGTVQWGQVNVPESVWNQADVGDYYDNRCVCVKDQ